MGRICLASSHMQESSNIEQHTYRSLRNPEIGELKFGAQIQRQRLGRTFLLARIPKHPTVTLNERTAKGCPHPFLTRKPNMFWLVVSTPLKNMSSSVGIILHNMWKVIKFHGSSHHQAVTSVWLVCWTERTSPPVFLFHGLRSRNASAVG